jgi:hypothetical protein
MIILIIAIAASADLYRLASKAARNPIIWAVLGFVAMFVGSQAGGRLFLQFAPMAFDGSQDDRISQALSLLAALFGGLAGYGLIRAILVGRPNRRGEGDET